MYLLTYNIRREQNKSCYNFAVNLNKKLTYLTNFCNSSKYNNAVVLHVPMVLLPSSVNIFLMKTWGILSNRKPFKAVLEHTVQEKLHPVEFRLSWEFYSHESVHFENFSYSKCQKKNLKGHTV